MGDIVKTWAPNVDERGEMTQTHPVVGGSGSVLLIDDDEQVRAIMRVRLEASNFLVTEAATGEDGLQIVGDDIDLVIVDVGLPGIDGFTVVRAIRERHDMPIIMVTGADEEADRVLGTRDRRRRLCRQAVPAARTGGPRARRPEAKRTAAVEPSRDRSHHRGRRSRDRRSCDGGEA